MIWWKKVKIRYVRCQQHFSIPDKVYFIQSSLASKQLKLYRHVFLNNFAIETSDMPRLLSARQSRRHRSRLPQDVKTSVFANQLHDSLMRVQIDGHKNAQAFADRIREELSLTNNRSSFGYFGVLEFGKLESAFSTDWSVVCMSQIWQRICIRIAW